MFYISEWYLSKKLKQQTIKIKCYVFSVSLMLALFGGGEGGLFFWGKKALLFSRKWLLNRMVKYSTGFVFSMNSKNSIQSCWGIPVTNKKWMHKRPGSWHIRTAPGWPLTDRWIWRLIRTTNSTARCGEWRGMMLPTMIMEIHCRKSIRRRYLTRHWWTIPVTVETRTIWNTCTGIWGWGMNCWPNVSYIWTWMNCRCWMFSKDGMLSR